MLIIHIKTTKDTEDFSSIYVDLSIFEPTILINPSKSEAKKAIINEKDTIVLIGHGNENGLFNPRMDGFIVDANTVQFLREKTIIGIWCFAGNFADKYDLTGFFSSMFISNPSELVEIAGFEEFDNCEDIIRDENLAFSNKINNLIRTDVPTNEWADRLNESVKDNPHKFVHYNYEAMWSKDN